MVDDADPIRVLLVEDQDLLRGALRVLLDATSGITPVGEAADGDEAIAAAEALLPDVVLMDIRMPGLDGLTATRAICARTTARVVVLTTFDLDEYVADAMAAGASGFLLKNAGPEALIRGIRAVAAGEALLAPEITRQLIEDLVQRRQLERRPRPASPGLTAREREVLTWVAGGSSNDEIAGALFLSPATVKTYVSRLLSRLGLRDRAQLVMFAYETGVVVPRAWQDPGIPQG